MAVFPHRDDEAIASGILISVHLAVPAVIFVIDCNSEGSPSGEHLRVPGSVRPGDVLGERIYLQPPPEFTSYFDKTTEMPNNNYNSHGS